MSSKKADAMKERVCKKLLRDAGLTQIDHLIPRTGTATTSVAWQNLRRAFRFDTSSITVPNAQDDFARASADEFVQKTYPQLYSRAMHTVAKPV